MSDSDPLDLTGHVALISGGCGELGLAIVEKLLDHGATVVANDILPPDEAHHRLPQRAGVHYVQGASSSPENAEEIFNQALLMTGQQPNTVLCHAGIVQSSPIDEFPTDAFDQIVATNLRAGFLLAQAASIRWKTAEMPGHLIFTSSWVADTPWPGIAPYSATKAALNALVRNFARELAPWGIRANAIAPGIVAAGMALRQWNTEPDYRRRAEKAIPLGQLQSTDSVSDAFLFTCSRMADYMTGSVLLVDGGCSLYPMD